jgi:hypothetical protein
MAAKTFVFVSRRIQPAVFAFLCIALAQLGMALVDYQAQQPSAAVARVHIERN